MFHPDENIKLLSQDLPTSGSTPTQIRRSRSESHSDVYEELSAEDHCKIRNGKNIVIWALLANNYVVHC